MKKLFLLGLVCSLLFFVVACSDETSSQQASLELLVEGEGTLVVNGEKVGPGEEFKEHYNQNEKVKLEVVAGKDQFSAYHILGEEVKDSKYELLLDTGKTNVIAKFNDSQASEGPLAEIEGLKDQGLHWFDTGNRAKKYEPGEKNPYFDKDSPTVIYVHGWQEDSVIDKTKEDFIYVHDDKEIDTIKAWREKGWNVGIFYWTRFADEDEVKDAEAKIWSVEGPKNMRWRKEDGSYVVGPKLSAAELFYQDYKVAMSDYQGDNIRIAGHSLGNQMAVRVTKLINQGIKAGELKEDLLPNRVALLDPFWSRGSKDFLAGDWVGERVRFAVRDLRKEGVLFEQYRSTLAGGSSWLVGDKNEELFSDTAFTELLPWHLGGVEMAKKHVYARHWYFWSKEFGPPVEATVEGGFWGIGERIVPTGKAAASAATPDSRIANMTNDDYRWVQIKGRRTATPQDNWYEKVRN